MCDEIGKPTSGSQRWAKHASRAPLVVHRPTRSRTGHGPRPPDPYRLPDDPPDQAHRASAASYFKSTSGGGGKGSKLRSLYPTLGDRFRARDIRERCGTTNRGGITVDQVLWSALAVLAAAFVVFFVLEWRTTRGRMIQAARTDAPPGGYAGFGASVEEKPERDGKPVAA